MEVTMENHGSHLNTITPISYLMVAPNIDLSLFNRSSKGSFVHNILCWKDSSLNWLLLLLTFLFYRCHDQPCQDGTNNQTLCEPIALPGAGCQHPTYHTDRLTCATGHQGRLSLGWQGKIFFWFCLIQLCLCLNAEHPQSARKEMFDPRKGGEDTCQAKWRQQSTATMAAGFLSNSHLLPWAKSFFSPVSRSLAFNRGSRLCQQW